MLLPQFLIISPLNTHLTEPFWNQETKILFFFKKNCTTSYNFEKHLCADSVLSLDEDQFNTEATLMFLHWQFHPTSLGRRFAKPSSAYLKFNPLE